MEKLSKIRSDQFEELEINRMIKVKGGSLGTRTGYSVNSHVTESTLWGLDWGDTFITQDTEYDPDPDNWFTS